MQFPNWGQVCAAVAVRCVPNAHGSRLLLVVDTKTKLGSHGRHGSADHVPRSWRCGKILLISKCKEAQLPRSLNDARPITLLGTDYKVLSKALALHLGRHMSELSVAEQRAFVHGRDIRHNIIKAESHIVRQLVLLHIHRVVHEVEATAQRG